MQRGKSKPSYNNVYNFLTLFFIKNVFQFFVQIINNKHSFLHFKIKLKYFSNIEFFITQVFKVNR